MTSEQEHEVQYLWRLLPHPSPDHVVRLFARGPDGEKFGDFARSPEDILRFIDASPGKNIYVGPNPTTCTTGLRITAAEVTHWSWVLLDIDPVDPDPLPDEALDEALLWLGEWMGRDFNPVNGGALVLDSGRGHQAWLRLNDTLLDDGVDDIVRVGDFHDEDYKVSRKTARKSMGFWLKRLATKLGTYQGCRLDSCTSDLPRVMRCPGTYNVKTGRMAKLLVIPGLDGEKWARHPGLDYLLVAGTPRAVFNEPEPGQVAPGTPWQAVYTKLTLKAQQYLMRGKEDPGRHETMWHTAKKLQETGIDRVEARKALQYANNLLGPDLALPDEQIETDLNQVYGRA